MAFFLVRCLEPILYLCFYTSSHSSLHNHTAGGGLHIIICGLHIIIYYISLLTLFSIKIFKLFSRSSHSPNILKQGGLNCQSMWQIKLKQLSSLIRYEISKWVLRETRLLLAHPAGKSCLRQTYTLKLQIQYNN